MTLVDSRPGIAAAFRPPRAYGRARRRGTGRLPAGPAAADRAGALVPAGARRGGCDALPGAVSGVRDHPGRADARCGTLRCARQARGGRTMVVTAKMGRLAKLHLDHLGLPADELAGDVFAEQKAVALREHGATLYVGDHVADMAAARAAGIPGVAVATGPCSADELTEAGAYLVLDDLVEFPRALDRIIGLALEG
ncbi:HAD hydrolase-like protein [Micromonospora sp. BRA006-A]|nr:HAD hydrolase-like protein [Micromonospora sp. BRA006-A]